MQIYDFLYRVVFQYIFTMIHSVVLLSFFLAKILYKSITSPLKTKNLNLI